ncbi:type II toxin-antitoxin system Phd/YefM family antitoxin [Salmonella enterica]|nr:type II toxin-antitoxin system Phd/YefM family antitoxin [Salmonella enterica]
MAFQILTTTAASITELKRDPMGTFNAGDGAPVAILNRNEPVFYCVPPALYAHLMDILEDEELGRIIDERANERVMLESVKMFVFFCWTTFLLMQHVK